MENGKMKKLIAIFAMTAVISALGCGAYGPIKVKYGDKTYKADKKSTQASETNLVNARYYSFKAHGEEKIHGTYRTTSIDGKVRAYLRYDRGKIVYGTKISIFLGDGGITCIRSTYKAGKLVKNEIVPLSKDTKYKSFEAWMKFQEIQPVKVDL